MVLGAFVEKHPQDQQLQLTLARRLAERGQKYLAMKQPAKAQEELEKSSTVFTRLLSTANDWKVLTPVEMTSDNGVRMELQKDGSFFVHQNHSVKNDTYTLVFRTEWKGITALRLEALADPRLPQGGPGWARDGNFVLSEVTLDAAAISPRATLEHVGSVVGNAPLCPSMGPAPLLSVLGAAAGDLLSPPIALRNPIADYSQGGRGIGEAVDGNAGTGWEVMPEVNKDHTAIFDLAEPVGDGRPYLVTVRLEHRHENQDCNLGRFRLAFSNDAAVSQAIRIRFQDLKDSEISDVYAAIGTAQARQGQTTEAIASFAQALSLAADHAGKAKIIAEAAPLQGVLEKLAERASSDARFQAELARHFAAQGQGHLANAARAKARALFEAKLVKEPENAALAAEVSELLQPRVDNWMHGVGVLVPTGERETARWRFTTNQPAADWAEPGFNDSTWQDGVAPFGSPPFPGARTRWTTPDVWLRRGFECADVKKIDSIFLRVLFDDSLEVFLNGKLVFGRDIHSDKEYVLVELGQQIRGLLVPGTNTLAVHCHDVGGESYIDAGLYAPMERLSAWAIRLSKFETTPWPRLAVAYAVNGLNDLALQHFSTALKLADGYEARKSILEMAARFDEVLTALSNRYPDDPQLQLALARNLAERGKQRLAEKQPAKAQAELEKSRAIFTRLRFPGNNWKPLTPVEMKADSGTKMQLQTDGSVFVHQGQPFKNDTYTLVFQTELKDIADLRLEALADSRLPGGGPGWNHDGNFVLSELTLQAAPAKNPDKARAIALRNAWADYSQDQPLEYANVRGAIDRNPRTGWAISPEFNKDHTAVFELAEKVGDGGASRLTVRLIQQHPNVQTKLGRFRLSFTNDRATAQAASIRGDLKDSELEDLYTALGKAYGQQGQTKEAVASFTEALHLSADRSGKAWITAEAAPLAGVAEKLIEQASDDGQLQVELARQFAARGKLHLAEKQPEQAQAELEKARKTFARLRAEYPVPQWIVLKPTEMTSKGGATLSLLVDGSILASGKNPARDEYMVVARSGLKHITALRLETLPDPSLPRNGPGRGPYDGNFHLNKLRVFSGGQPCPLTKIIVDHPNMIGRMIGHTPTPYQQIIDGKVDNMPGWGNWPRFGQPNTAIIATRVARAPKDDLKIEMVFSQSNWLQLNLGRFRLAVTNAADPIKATEFHKALQEREVADVYVALATAHVQQGHTDEAKKLIEQAPEDGPFQADLARQFAAQGQATLAKAALAKARAWYEARLAKEPENSAWAAELADLLLPEAPTWTILKPTEMKSNSGVMLTMKEDQSILVSGKYAAKDTYSLDFEDIPQGFHAIRLEALRDDRLPSGGPGTHGGGNFVLSELKVFRLDERQASGLKQILLRSACATFEERPAQQSLDAIPSGGWSIHGGQHQSQTAYFSVEGGAKIPVATRLRILLVFSHIAPRGEPATLGRFRLSVSTDANAFDREKLRLAATKITDPWAKLAAAYHVLGDQQALDNLLKHHPAAAAGIAELYVAAGRTREGIPYLVKASTANPKDTMLSLKVAALQAWFGQEKELAATRQRILAFAKKSNEPGTAERAAKICSMLPSIDKAEREAALALARKGEEELVQGKVFWGWALLALGMAEYRSGNYAAAEEALLDAAKTDPNNPYVLGTSAFYRAMILFRQGKPDEARKLAIEAAAKMKPLPKDEQNPLAGGADHDYLILWLAYKEAKAMIGFDAAPPPKADDNKK
jgi:tetratricopeptide (TPR) repeat protein